MKSQLEKLVRLALFGLAYSDLRAFTAESQGRTVGQMKPPMTLKEKLELAIFEHGPYFIMEMPADPSFLYHEGRAMQHCLAFCFADYAKRIKDGSQRQFSLVDRRTGRPCVNIELSLKQSSYSGPVKRPVVTQIRGFRNQCPPRDEYLPAVMAFLQTSSFDFVNHGVRNFDGQRDGEKVFDRWMEISGTEDSST